MKNFTIEFITFSNGKDCKFAPVEGIQYGGSHFNYKNGNNEWHEHFGIKANLGFWL